MRIVVIGGGTGTFSVLSGMRELDIPVTAIVSTADNGGSTGQLRDELGVLPPGDIRQALVALSEDGSVLRELFSYRFEEGTLKGHAFGNLFLSALEKVTGSFDQAVLEAGKVLNIKGEVIPVTTANVHLAARFTDGRLITGEHQVDTAVWSELGSVEKIWLEPACQLHPQARRAILAADLIVMGPGSIFTSLIPNLLVEGMQEALTTTKAPLVYISNLMTEKGHTGSFTVQDYAALMMEYLPARGLDYVVYNTQIADTARLERYRKEMERIPVQLARGSRAKLPYQLIGAKLLGAPKEKVKGSDPLAAQRTLIRHDPSVLAEVLRAIVLHRQIRKYFPR